MKKPEYIPTPIHITKRGKVVAASTVGLAAAGLVATAIASYPTEVPSTKGDLVCRTYVRFGDTQSGIADDFRVNWSQVKAFHPDSLVAETNPSKQMQPGDTALVVGVNSAICNELGGVVIGKDNTKPIIE